MARMNLAAFIGLTVLLLTSCNSISGWNSARKIQKHREAALEEVDVVGCKASGGTIKGVCMFGMPACVRPYTDAGKTCTDGSQCEGNCLQQEPWAPVGTEIFGICEATDEPCGCQAFVTEGRAEAGLCED